MENNRQVGASSFDHLFGPKDSSSSSSTSSGIFGSIFPPPSKVPAGRDSGITGNHVGNEKYVNPDNATPKAKGERSGISGKGQSSAYQNETPEPCNFSSSIYYGGQENYSPRTKYSDSQHVVSTEYSRKIMKRMIRMETIQTALREGTGGRASSHTLSNCRQHTSKLRNMTMSSLNIVCGTKRLIEISVRLSLLNTAGQCGKLLGSFCPN
ncbi:hypothetical protein SADUNF_Sadunf08G0049300 [Salix dunnii]|uniref:Uncharacterized protein n=1 Tax=Salix dunnii TaxID=1413687 RepID=A0A835MU81_9ROSI|nr:hypothetical protein SADUNF_Sadunf08G0049300 [Salix dunnii]